MVRTRWPRPPIEQSMQHLVLNDDTQDYQLYRTRIRGWGRELMIGYKAHVHEGMVVDECRFRGEPNPADRKNHVKWGARMYGLRGLLVTGTEFRKIGIEHGWYGNFEGGDNEFNDCFFEDVAAQAIQATYRPSESPRAQDPIDGTEIRVINCIFKRCTSPHTGRAAFTVTIVNMNRSGLVQGCNMVAQFPPNSSGSRSRGAIVMHHVPHATVLDTKIDYSQPDRPVVQLHDIPGDVVIEDCNIRRGMVSIRRVGGSITVQHNRGNALLYVDGVKQGPISEDYYS